MQRSGLEGRHALITGGGTGIGAATAQMLTEAGAGVTILGRREEPLEKVVREGAATGWLQCDVTRESALRNAIELARVARGPISILIVNAGIGDSAPFGQTTREQWDRLIAVNLTAAFDCAQAALPDLTSHDDSRIVFVASIAGLRGVNYASAYSASKHGLIGLMRSMALEYARSRLTVNAVCPGFVDTPMTDESAARVAGRTGRGEAEARAALAAMNASGRLVAPEEVADVIAMLCKPESRSINGAAIPIDGGTMA